MIVNIEFKQDKFSLAQINSLKEFGVNITAYEPKDYSYWSFSAETHLPSDFDKAIELTDDEKRTKMYEHAVRTDSHKYNILDKVILVDLMDFINVFPHIQFSVIKTFANKVVHTADNAAEQLFNIVDRLKEKLVELTDLNMNRQTMFNDKCQVHIGGSHLLLINELKLEEDCCTDHLQLQLDNGWRIVSVNHQEQRRPDYVLGKYNPALD